MVRPEGIEPPSTGSEPVTLSIGPWAHLRIILYTICDKITREISKKNVEV
jgi:hypothetical protein